MSADRLHLVLQAKVGSDCGEWPTVVEVLVRRSCLGLLCLTSSFFNSRLLKSLVRSLQLRALKVRYEVFVALYHLLNSFTESLSQIEQSYTANTESRPTALTQSQCGKTSLDGIWHTQSLPIQVHTPTTHLESVLGIQILHRIRLNTTEPNL